MQARAYSTKEGLRVEFEDGDWHSEEFYSPSEVANMGLVDEDGLVAFLRLRTLERKAEDRGWQSTQAPAPLIASVEVDDV